MATLGGSTRPTHRAPCVLLERGASIGLRLLGALAFLAALALGAPNTHANTPRVEAAIDAAERARGERDVSAARDADLGLEAVLPEADVEHQAHIHFKRGELAELRNALAEAAVHYQASIDADASSRFAGWSLRRRNALQRMLDRDPEGYTRFRQIIRAYPDAGSETSVQAIEALLADTENPDLRTELLVWLGNEWMYVRQDFEQARQTFLRAIELDNLTSVQLYEAFFGAAAASTTYGSLGETLDVLRAFIEAHPDEETRRALDVIHRDLIDRRGRFWAERFFALCALLFGVQFARRRPWRALRWSRIRAWQPWKGLAFLTLGFGVGGYLAEQYDHGHLYPFVACIPLVGLVYLAAGAMRWADPDRAQSAVDRALTALAVTGTTLGAVYLALDVFDRQAIFGL